MTSLIIDFGKFTKKPAWGITHLRDASTLEWNCSSLMKIDSILTVIHVLFLDVYEVCKEAKSSEAARLKEAIKGVSVYSFSDSEDKQTDGIKLS